MINMTDARKLSNLALEHEVTSNLYMIEESILKACMETETKLHFKVLFPSRCIGKNDFLKRDFARKVTERLEESGYMAMYDEETTEIEIYW